MSLIETQTYRGYEIRILSDEYAENPNQRNGSDTVFVCGIDDRNFWVDDYDYRKELVQDLMRYQLYKKKSAVEPENYEEVREVMKKYHVFLIAAYIHSGVVLSLDRKNFHGRLPEGHYEFDTGYVGALFVKREEYKSRKDAEGVACGFLEEWNDYLSGNVYGYEVLDKDGNELDSCFGFYGDYEQYAGALDEARWFIDYEITKKIKEHQKVLKQQIKNGVGLQYRKPLEV